MITFKTEMARIIRDSTHNSVIDNNDELNNDLYFTRLKYFITMLEGSSNEAYLDGILDPQNSTRFITAKKFYSLSNQTQEKLKADAKKIFGRSPVTTVGIGANIESECTNNRYDNLLGEAGLMEKVYYGRAALTDEQIDLIFKDDIGTRMEELHKIYGTDWEQLRINERIGIISLYFNLPGLVNDKTNFRHHIRNYINTNNPSHLKLACIEIQKYSNLRNDPGIQNRRDAEAKLLASYNSPTYTKPDEAPDSIKLVTAELNKTIVPLNKDDTYYGINSEYFIWRTQMDNKVRNDHALLEGKIFRKNSPHTNYMPGEMHNCRCLMEEVPDYILINDESSQNKAFELYLRKGIIHPAYKRTRINSFNWIML